MRKSAANTIASNILTDYIHNSLYAVGDRLPTVRDLEKQYSPVSRNTVVHALGMLENEGWVEKRQGLGCYVTNKTEPERPNLIGFVTASTESDVVLRIYDGIQSVCNCHDMHVLMASVDNDYDTERKQVQKLIDAGCQALVMYPVTRTAEQLKTDYLNSEHKDFPIVLVDIAYIEQARPVVVFDNYQAGFDMTQMLLEEGHKRIAFMSARSQNAGILMHYSTRERYRGFQDACHLAGIPISSRDIWEVDRGTPVSQCMEDLARDLDKWAADTDHPTALIAIDDEWALSTIQTAQHLGIRIPEDLFIVGFDNRLQARSFTPAFPSTNPDFQSAGEMATRIAIRQNMEKTNILRVYTLPVPILRRDRS